MKKVTRNDIYDEGKQVLQCGYCNMQALLRFHHAKGYNAGVYGWNFDAYYINDVIICTGYRNMPGKVMVKVNDYEEKAIKILKSEDSQEIKMKKIDALLFELCNINRG